MTEEKLIMILQAIADGEMEIEEAYDEIEGVIQFRENFDGDYYVQFNTITATSEIIFQVVRLLGQMSRFL